ncbi:MAG: dTDP-glucose 4,6-dehydratase [Rhizobiales bacterium]|nr:dTDP-glucose 4,6-dehydratase [Hyphomicrobiales bacterium]
MNVVVTGGAGFIGAALVRHLIVGGHRVLNIDRLSYSASPEALAALPGNPLYRFVHLDIRERTAIAALLAEFCPDTVLHLAAETHVDRSIDNPALFIEHNIVGSMELLEAVRGYWQGLGDNGRLRFRYIQVSTDEVFGSLGDGDAAFTADMPYHPNSPYAASKAGSDHLARAWGTTYGLPVIITNCSNNYGPFQFPEKLIPLMIIKALHGEMLPVYGQGLNTRDWIHVDDHARALIAAAERGQPGNTYLIGADCERRNLTLVETICDEVDRLAPSPAGPRRRLIHFVADRPGHDFRYAIDSAPARRGLDWEPRVSMAEGIRATVLWYLENRDWWQPILDGRYDGRRLGRAAVAVDAAKRGEAT